MADATHVGVLDLDSDADRKEIFLGALQNTAAQLNQPAQGSALDEASREPLQFLDAPPEIHEDVASVAFVIHGIRDDGSWTHRVAAAIKSEWDQIEHAGQMEVYPTWTHSYGYFPMLPFVLPWIRKSKVEWFMDNYVSMKAAYPYATFHYVGHSNGTYLAATALKDYPAARFGAVYFAGSVIHPNYDWKRAFDCFQIKKFHNARGGEDWVVALLPKSLEYFSDLGGGGFDGFDEANVVKGEPTWPKADCFTQSEKFAKGGHGGAISEPHWGEIAKFIVGDKKPFEAGEPDWLFAQGQHRLVRILGALRIGVPLGFGVAALLVLLAVVVPLFDHWRFNVVAVTLLGIGWLAVAAKLMRPAALPATAPKLPPAEKATPTWLIWAMSCGFVVLCVAAAGVVAGTGGWLWGGALAGFLALQYCTDRDWSKLVAALRSGQRSAIFDSWRPQRAPTGRPARILLRFFAVLAAVFLVWALWSLLSILGGLTEGIGGAVTRFFLIVLGLWFVMTRV